MNGHLRSKALLLSRVSSLAIVAAAGMLGTVQQAEAACDTTLNSGVVVGNFTVGSPVTCVVVDGNVSGDAINNTIVGDPGTGFTPFDVQQTVSGSVINNGNISGGYSGAGERGALTISGAVLNGIVNNGLITSASGNGIQIGTGGENSGSVDGGIVNNDSISSGTRYGVAALEGTLTGGLRNESGATLNGGLAAIFIDDAFASWSGGIQNSGTILGVAGAIVMGDGGGSATTFAGGITNDGGALISSVGGAAIVITNDIASFDGGIANFGQIEGADDAIRIDTELFSGGVYNEVFASIVASSGNAIESSTDNWSGGFDNRGFISGQDSAFVLLGGEGSAFNGDVLNSGTMVGGEGSGIYISASSIGGETGLLIRNTGDITAQRTALFVLGDDVNASFTNDSSNPGFSPPGDIVSESGAAVVLAARGLWQGNITNDGTLSGQVGAVLGGTFTDGFFVNSAGGDFQGSIVNNGRIDGGAAGLIIVGDAVDVTNGGFVNNGTINDGGQIGDVTGGLYVSVDAWDGNITNTGLIEGTVRGAYINANEFTGDIVNDGTIRGGAGTVPVLFDPGLVVSVGTYTGNITNNGTLSANSNALVADIGNLTGTITNTGLIEATNVGDTAVLLEVGNGATFVNTGGGIVLGDIVFGGKAAYDFVAEDGGVEGSLIGQGGASGNDDVITVQSGTHYFVDGGGENGTASNFASFNVDAGGFAVMGAVAEGASGGTGYSFSNVDALNVNNGGTLYIDKSTTLNVDGDYTQQAGGTLEFYLGAPSGISTATGAVVAGAGDYGQILVGGTANLDGIIAGFLDPAFGSANPDLDIVEYNDVIVADDIEGDFSTLALINSNSIFELDSIVDGNTVDLRVQRTADIGHIGGLGGIVVETAGPWKSMVNDRSNGIGSGSCGLAGGGWCFNQFADAGASQVMTDATPGEDPFGWLRTGVRRVGETAVWGRAVGVWGETDGDAGSSGTDFDVVGGIVGVDHVFTPVLLAGLAAQWTTSDVEFKGLPDNAEIDSFEVGAYASYGDTRLYLNANASVIWHDIEVNRFALGGQAFGDYDGTTISAYVEAGKIFETESGFRIQPLVALSYAHLETDAYSETGGPGVSLLNVFESDFDTLKSNIGARFAYPIALQSGRKLVPEARIVWAHEFLDDQSAFLATIQGGPPTPSLIVGEKYSRDTLILGTGVTAPLSDATTLFFDYDAGLNSDITTHTVSAGFRTRW